MRRFCCVERSSLAVRKFKQPAPNKGKYVAPQPTVEESPEQQPPVFSLRYLQKDWGLSDCDKEEKAAFADTLGILSQMTWAQIKGAHRHGKGTEKIDRKAIKAPIPSHVTEDVVFLAIRFASMKAMVGYRDGVVFYVLWLDRGYNLYSHG